jgi:hypothetical protein
LEPTGKRDNLAFSSIHKAFSPKLQVGGIGKPVSVRLALHTTSM